jgi:hypothetical protein
VPVPGMIVNRHPRYSTPIENPQAERDVERSHLNAL